MQSINNNKILHSQIGPVEEVPWLGLLQIMFIVVATTQIVFSMWWTSPTADESRHFEWSRKIVETGVVAREINSVTQAPVINVLTSYLDHYTPKTILKEEFSGQRAWFFKRLGTLFWFYLLVLGVRVFLKYTSLPYADTLGIALVTADPTILAHSSLVTVDTAFAAVVVWFLYVVFRYLSKPTFILAVTVGFSTMSLFATKFTAILFLPLFLYALIVPFLRRYLNKLDVGYFKLFFFSLASLVSFFILINAIFLFIDVQLFISAYKLKSPILLDFVAVLPDLFLPLPQSFIDGIDQCLSHERGVSWNVIFNDSWNPNGSVWYFPYMFIYKNTLLTISVIGLSLFLAVKDGIIYGQKFILIVLIFSLSYFCFIFKTQVGIRYIIFILPLIYLFCVQSLVRYLDLKLNIVLSLLVFVNSLICLYPNRGVLLTYFNPVFVSSKQPYLYLVDSNFDWFSSEYQLRKEEEDRFYAFEIRDPTLTQPGVNLYSANYLAGVLWDFERNKWLRRNIEPDERIAQTYFKFEMDHAKYLRYVKEVRDFKPYEGSLDDCENLISLGSDSKDIPVHIKKQDLLCLDIKNQGAYLFRSKKNRQSIGIFTLTEGCRPMNFKKNEYVPFYLQQGIYKICSATSYEGTVSQLENEEI